MHENSQKHKNTRILYIATQPGQCAWTGVGPMCTHGGNTEYSTNARCGRCISIGAHVLGLCGYTCQTPVYKHVLTQMPSTTLPLSSHQPPLIFPYPVYYLLANQMGYYLQLKLSKMYRATLDK